MKATDPFNSAPGISLRFKFGALILLILVAVSALSLSSLIRSQERALLDNLQAQTDALGRFVALVAPEAIFAHDFVTLDHYMEEISASPDIVYAYIAAPNGAPMTSFVNPKNPRLKSRQAAKPEPITSLAKRVSAMPGLVTSVFRITFDGRVIARLTVAASRDGVDARVNAMIRSMAIYFAIVVAVLLGAIFVAFHSMILAPLKSLGEAAMRVSRGNLTLPAEVRANDEIGRLARLFNQMMERLGKSIDDKDAVTDALREQSKDLEHQKFALDQHAIVSIVGTDGLLLYVNPKLCTIAQYQAVELLGSNYCRLLDDGQETELEALRRAMGAGNVWQGELRQRKKDGTLYWVAASVVPFCDAAGKPNRHISIQTDITHIKQLEQALQNANEVLADRVAQRTAELSKAKHQLEADLIKHARMAQDLIARNDDLKQMNAKLEEAHNQLLQSEKMASIGQLAAGVAHEINNPIGYVQSNLGSLETYVSELLKVIADYESAAAGLPPGMAELFGSVRQNADLDFVRQDVQALLRESKEGVTRVKKIVQDLKDFSYVHSDDQWQFADLHHGLNSTLNIVWNELKYKAEVQKDYGDLPAVECLPSQINQVFMNLLVNAAQAIETRGKIVLRTGSVDDTVWIEIEDNGKGIPADIVGRIFDPFFTTKPIGKGTGLGLSLSYGIIQKHHGRIEVDSTPGRGTRFRVWLPVEHAKQPVAA